ncbi:MAG: hypothetical protein JNM17_05150 [Archangium sp.]|nr:hypothetical protein [Archangium sp.]
MVAFIYLVVAAAAPGEFELVEEVDGIRIESRPHAGSDFVDLRLSTTSPATVAKLCDTAFGDGKIPSDERTVRSRKVLSEAADSRVTYEQVSAPVVSDRDYSLKWTRSRVGDRCIVRFEITDASVPVTPKFLRLTVITGEWTFSPSADGKTRVQYVSHSEPGGGLPPFLVEGPRRRTELDVVRRTVARAQR